MPYSDELFEQFVEAYPASRRQRGYFVMFSFLAALDKAGWTVLANALEQHKRSEQWQNVALIPMMRKWLEEERWCQILPERGARRANKATQSVIDALNRDETYD